jgi:proteasome accessory factor A
VALDALADDPQSLVGSLDWVTKQFVLDKSARGASWEARKKIDIRYHELSQQGYFQRLRATGIVADLLDQSEIEHARRNPPAGTPAAVRGRYIREFADEEESISANWQAVFIGHGRDIKVVRLDRYHFGASDQAASRKKTARREEG